MSTLRFHIGILFGTILLIVIFSVIFSVNLQTEFSQNEIYDMSKTLLSVIATLYGLSAVAGGLLVVASTRKEMNEIFLQSKILGFVAISFLCFWFALIGALLSMINPTNKNAFSVSVAATVSGSLSGSLYLIYTFREYLLSHTREPKTQRNELSDQE